MDIWCQAKYVYNDIEKRVTMNTFYHTSLLWPPDSEESQAKSPTRLGENCLRDIDLTRTIQAFNSSQRHRQHIERILLNLCNDPQIIRYRQDVLDDLLTQPAVAEGFETLFSILDELAYPHYREDRDKATLHGVLWRMNELAGFIECVEGLNTIFQEAGENIRSQGLQLLRNAVASIERDATFQQLVQELPDLHSRLQSIRSISIGVNLDHNFHPVGATLLSVNKEAVTSASLLTKLLGRPGDDLHGIAPLHTAQKDIDTGLPVNPIMTPLFRDLANVLEKVCQPIAKALTRYITINSGLFANLAQELGFYLGAVKLIRRMTEADLPMCKPELVAREERLCDIEENFNLNLALRLLDEEECQNARERIVTNRVSFGSQGRVIVLTGPNQGGKTTYIQAIGLTHILAQAGLYVPGTTARLSPVDSVYTHFPIEEHFEQGIGRLGDEVKRLHAILTQATRHSLILLNESFSSTSPTESLYLALDIARILRLMGVRAIFSTHLHELAARVDDVNAERSGDNRILSMVASWMSDRENHETMTDGGLTRTYKVVPSPPMRSSHARELARQYGVSFEQLHAMLKERGILPVVETIKS